MSTIAPGSERFDRLERINWWEQSRVGAARVLVCGVGAIGNEVAKNLALLGAGRVVLADFDRVEETNLCRSVLFRDGDVGENKAEVAARRLGELYPDGRTRALDVDVVNGLGLGVYRWADVIIGGLDSREARLGINLSAWQTGTPWIDGATEVLSGLVRLFVPWEGPCYECTLGAADWDALEARRSCAFLTREAVDQGAVPTTSTTASLVAGVQVQEAMKLLHERSTMQGQGWMFDGNGPEAFSVTYSLDPACMRHDRPCDVVELPRRSTDVTLGELRRLARERLGAEAVLDLPREVIRALSCGECGASREHWAPLGSVSEAEAVCRQCAAPLHPELLGSIDDDTLDDRTPASLGLPPYDILFARAGETRLGFLMAADAELVLGDCFDDEESS